jgi:hypothetical protein
MGITVSFMYKYQDNIARILAIATSIGLTLILSVRQPRVGRVGRLDRLHPPHILRRRREAEGPRPGA